MTATPTTKKTWIKTIGTCHLYKVSTDYVMECDRHDTPHTISADPTITSPERLKAHWENFLKVNNETLFVRGRFTRNQLVEAIREAKSETDGDYCASDGQVLVIGADGERCTSDGGPAFYYSGTPTLDEIEDTFANYPDAVQVVVEGQSYVKGDWGSAIDRMENAEPCEWWGVTIERDIV